MYVLSLLPPTRVHLNIFVLEAFYLYDIRIVVHPNFSEAPHFLRELPTNSKSHPKHDINSKNQTAQPDELVPMAHVYTKNVIFRNELWHCDDFGLRNPVVQKIFQPKRATSIVERVTRYFYS